MSQQPRPAWGYVPGMEHFQVAPRKSWWRRHYKLWWVLGALVLAGVVAAIGNATSGGTPRDYRDPVQLAQAVKAQEHAAAASCGKLPTGKYFCTVAKSDGTSGTFTVTVAADGKSYQAG